MGVGWWCRRVEASAGRGATEPGRAWSAVRGGRRLRSGWPAGFAIPGGSLRGFSVRADGSVLRRSGIGGVGKRRTPGWWPVSCAGESSNPPADVAATVGHGQLAQEVSVTELSFEPSPTLGRHLRQIVDRGQQEAGRREDEAVESPLHDRPVGCASRRAAGRCAVPGVLRHSPYRACSSRQRAGSSALRGNRTGIRTRRAAWAGPAH